MAKQIIIEKSKIGDDPSTYRFTFDEDGIQKSGFIIFFDNAYYVYRNECQHLPVELDWQENEFLDDENNFIICDKIRKPSLNAFTFFFPAILLRS